MDGSTESGVSSEPSLADDTENFSVAATQLDRDEITRDSLVTTASIVAGLYLFLGTSHLFVVPAPHNITLAVTTLLSGLLIGAAGFMSYRSLIPVHAAHPVLFISGFMVLSNSVLHLYLTGDVMQTTNLALVLMAWGLFVLSIPWFVIFYCATAVIWIALQQVFSYNALHFSHYTFMLLSAAGIGTITFTARYRTYNRVISYRKQDIQIQRSLQRALARGEDADKAEARNEAKDTFIAHLSHELRTPLNAIIGFSDTIRLETMGPIGNSKYADYIVDIRDAGLHLTSILEDLHDLVLVEKGELKVHLTTFSAPQFVDSCIALVHHRAEDKKLSLSSECDTDLTYLTSDQKRFRQAIVNLLINATKYTREGGNISLTSSVQEDGRILFEVRDSGVGMTRNEIEKATSPFWRAAPDMSVGDVEGSGLGLAITTELVELLGGTFELISEKGRGTTARVWLPQSCRSYDQPSESSFAQIHPLK